MPDSNRESGYDLEERTAVFGERVIDFLKNLKPTVIVTPLVSQSIRSATSIGANYCEADDASSRKEFRQKIGYCRKEARETKHWLRMLARAVPDRAEEIRSLWKEANELHLIFAKIFRSASQPPE